MECPHAIGSCLGELSGLAPGVAGVGWEAGGGASSISLILAEPRERRPSGGSPDPQRPRKAQVFSSQQTQRRSHCPGTDTYRLKSEGSPPLGSAPPCLPAPLPTSPLATFKLDPGDPLWETSLDGQCLLGWEPQASVNPSPNH